METMRDIKRRINSVKNTQKITRAMKMVAAAKLRNSQKKAEAARPFFIKTRTILADVVKYSGDLKEHPLLIEREVENPLYIAINGDRGLCGAYNNNIIDRVEECTEGNKDISLLLIGKKVRDYFRRRNYNIISEYVKIDDYPDFEFASKIADEVISLFTEGIVDGVYLIYTHFNSAISQTVKTINILPVEPEIEGEEVQISRPDEEGEEKFQVDYIYEPSPKEVLDILLPQYIENVLYSALLEAKASEFGSRMTAMDSATDNASEMIDELTLSYNRARQAEITKEITEIVGGAEALE